MKSDVSSSLHPPMKKFNLFWYTVHFPDYQADIREGFFKFLKSSRSKDSKWVRFRVKPELLRWTSPSPHQRRALIIAPPRFSILRYCFHLHRRSPEEKNNSLSSSSLACVRTQFQIVTGSLPNAAHSSGASSKEYNSLLLAKLDPCQNVQVIIKLVLITNKSLRMLTVIRFLVV